MYALWMFTFFSAMIVMFTAATSPIESQRITQAKAEMVADNFLGYRRAVLAFKEDNHAFTGTATIAQITPYAYWGDVLENRFGNSIAVKEVYTWRTPPFLPLEADILAEKLGHSYTIGVKRGNTLWTQRGNLVRNTGIVLPAVIPDGALVAVD